MRFQLLFHVGTTIARNIIDMLYNNGIPIYRRRFMVEDIEEYLADMLRCKIHNLAGRRVC